MGRIIAIANQKGGVGKTTTAVNLSCALHELGKNVLMCDADPQGNATSGLGIDKNNVSPSTYDLLINGVAAGNAIKKTKYCDVIPANKSLAGAAIELVGMDRREYILKDALETLKDRYDYIFVDCPPSLELLTLNALNACASVMIPVQCEYYALEGLSDLVASIRMIKRRLNPDLDIEGIVLTMYDGRTNLSLQVAEEVRKYFGDKVYTSAIPRNVRLSEAPSHGKPVIFYDRASRGSAAYMELAKEIIRKEG